MLGEFKLGTGDELKRIYGLRGIGLPQVAMHSQLPRFLVQLNTSFHLLNPSPDFISFCAISALFISPAIPSICKILKLCPFGILS